MPFAIVSVERHRRSRLAGGSLARPIGRINEEQVLRSVVVKIEKSHATAHRFGQELLSVGAIVVHESDSRGCSHIDKARFGYLRAGPVRGWRARIARRCPAALTLMLPVPEDCRDY